MLVAKQGLSVIMDKGLSPLEWFSDSLHVSQLKCLPISSECTTAYSTPHSVNRDRIFLNKHDSLYCSYDFYRETIFILYAHAWYDFKYVNQLNQCDNLIPNNTMHESIQSDRPS